MFVGGGDFQQVGNELKAFLIMWGGLKPDDRILDVGSGIGRVALPLTNYLSPNGEYWGFDVVKPGIDWCQKHITPRYSNFHFLHCDLYNKYYAPKGKIKAWDFRFPFEDDFFDYVFLTSVFTHMLPRDMENYFREISRVLRRNGNCFITFFLLNEEALQLIKKGSSTLDFKYEIEGYLTTDKERPEDAIAYKEEDILGLFKKYGFRINQPIFRGIWCGRMVKPDDDNSGLVSYQDTIVATRT